MCYLVKELTTFPVFHGKSLSLSLLLLLLSIVYYLEIFQ